MFQFNWYTKRGSLAAVYKSTEIFMIQDRSEDRTDTWTFLDRRLDNLTKVASTLRNVHFVLHTTQPDCIHLPSVTIHWSKGLASQSSAKYSKSCAYISVFSFLRGRGIHSTVVHYSADVWAAWDQFPPVSCWALSLTKFPLPKWSLICSALLNNKYLSFILVV